MQMQKKKNKKNPASLKQTNKKKPNNKQKSKAFSGVWHKFM